MAVVLSFEGGGLYPNVEMKRMQMGKVPCFMISTYY